MAAQLVGRRDHVGACHQTTLHIAHVSVVPSQRHLTHATRHFDFGLAEQPIVALHLGVGLQIHGHRFQQGDFVDACVTAVHGIHVHFNGKRAGPQIRQLEASSSHCRVDDVAFFVGDGHVPRSAGIRALKGNGSGALAIARGVLRGPSQGWCFLDFHRGGVFATVGVRGNDGVVPRSKRTQGGAFVVVVPFVVHRHGSSFRGHRDLAAFAAIVLDVKGHVNGGWRNHAGLKRLNATSQRTFRGDHAVVRAAWQVQKVHGHAVARQRAFEGDAFGIGHFDVPRSVATRGDSHLGKRLSLASSARGMDPNRRHNHQGAEQNVGVVGVAIHGKFLRHAFFHGDLRIGAIPLDVGAVFTQIQVENLHGECVVDGT